MLHADQIKDLKKREGMAKNMLNDTWLAEFADIARYNSPERLKYLQSTIDEPGRRRIDRKKILNDAHFRAIDVALSGIKGGSIPHSLPWFKMGLFNTDLEKYEPVKDWLHTVQTWMYGVFSRSNFYDAMTQPYYEALLFGTGAFQVNADFEEIIDIEPWTIGQYSILLGDKREVDTAFRRRFYPLRVLVETYGLKALSIKLQSVWKHNKDQNVEVVQAVYPRKDYDHAKLDATNMPWASVWWEQGGDNDKILKESGFRSRPVMFPRWDSVADEAWGTSCPGMKTIQNVKMLQALERDSLLIAGQKGRPAMNVPSKLRGRLQIHPAAQNWVSEKEAETIRRTLEYDPDASSIDLKIAQTLDRIERGFFNDLFLMIADDDTTQKTAFEIARKHDEKLAILSPTLERLNRTALSPVIARVFEIGTHRGLIPEPPDELDGENIKVEYVSILAQAQKAAGIKTTEQMIDFVGRVGAAQAGAGLAPTAMDKLDLDSAIDDFADNIGANPKIVIGTDEANALRDKRAQDQQEQAQQEQMGQFAAAAKDLGQANMGGDETLLSELSKQIPAP